MGNTKRELLRGLSEEEIPADLVLSELRAGIEEEYEHTDDWEEARKIALDHLWERSDYYSQLKACMTPNRMSREDLYERWLELVNMDSEDLELFLDRWGHVAGLSRAEASSAGIKSGRDSGRAILRMQAKDPEDWTESDWAWARRQVGFNSRMSGSRGPLIRDGKLTRKYLSLLVWGHDPLDGEWKEYEEAEKGGRMKANPRAIPIPTDTIEEIAQWTEEYIHAYACEVATELEPLGNVVLNRPKPFTYYDELQGKYARVYVLLSAKPAQSAYYISQGGLGTERDTGRRIIVLYVNGSHYAETYCQATEPGAGGLVAQQARKVLEHEFTHLVDPDPSPGYGRARGYSADVLPSAAVKKQGLDEYFNHPQEVRAYAREIVEELRPAVKHLATFRKLFGDTEAWRHFFQRSDTWVEVRPHLTEKNQRLVMQVVSRELFQ